jgi:hypothetical protein
VNTRARRGGLLLLALIGAALSAPAWAVQYRYTLVGTGALTDFVHDSRSMVSVCQKAAELMSVTRSNATGYACALTNDGLCRGEFAPGESQSCRFMVHTKGTAINAYQTFTITLAETVGDGDVPPNQMLVVVTCVLSFGLGVISGQQR